MIDLDSDAIFGLLVDATGAAISDSGKRAFVYESDVNGHEVSGAGYTARGQALAGLSLSVTSNVLQFTATNPAWTVATITASGIWILSHKSTAATSPLIFYLDFGASKSSSGGTFTVAFDGTNGICLESGG